MTFDDLDLVEDGDRVYVTMRHPQTVPVEWITRRDVPVDPTGRPLDPQDAQLAAFEVVARLITDWRVYDATAQGDEQPTLELPATAEAIGKLPLAIQNKLSEEVQGRINPTKTPTTSN